MLKMLLNLILLCMRLHRGCLWDRMSPRAYSDYHNIQFCMGSLHGPEQDLSLLSRPTVALFPSWLFTNGSLVAATVECTALLLSFFPVHEPEFELEHPAGNSSPGPGFTSPQGQGGGPPNSHPPFMTPYSQLMPVFTGW